MGSLKFTTYDDSTQPHSLLVTANAMYILVMYPYSNPIAAIYTL